jgi:hypothetical protein
MGRDDDPAIRFDLPLGWGEETKPSPDVKPTKLSQPDYTTRSEQIVEQSRKARREPLLHFGFRIPWEMLSKLDDIAAERKTSTSQVIRTILANALKRRRRATRS